MANPRVLVVIVNWNNAPDTNTCVDSVMGQSYATFDLVVVDNGSEIQDFDALQKHCEQYPEVRLFQNSENVGFTRAVNQCLESYVLDRDDYQFVALLNNDAIADTNWLQNAIETARIHEGALIASRMISHEHPTLIDCAGLFLLDTGEVLPRGFGASADPYNDPQKVLGPCGGAAVYPVAVFDEVGVFDTDYPMGYEDAEFALRVMSRGIPTYYEPTSVVRHKGSVSLNKIRSTHYLVERQYQIWCLFLEYTPLLGVMIGSVLILVRMVLVFVFWFVTLQWKSIWIWICAFFKILQNMPGIVRRRSVAQKSRTISTLAYLKQQHSCFVSDVVRFFRRRKNHQKHYFS